MKVKRRIKNNSSLLLTPLIDMIFLVVIFFMINATMAMNPAVSVNLPEAYTAKSVVNEEVVVIIKPGGLVYIGKDLVKIDNFPAEIKNAVNISGKHEVFLQVDESVMYRYVMEIIDLCRLAGIKKVSMIAKKKSLAR